MLDEDQFAAFSSYNPSSSLSHLQYPGFEVDMKRTLDSSDGPDTVKKARQYPPSAYDQASAAFYQPQISSPAALYSSGLNSSMSMPSPLGNMTHASNTGLQSMGMQQSPYLQSSAGVLNGHMQTPNNSTSLSAQQAMYMNPQSQGQVASSPQAQQQFFQQQQQMQQQQQQQTQQQGQQSNNAQMNIWNSGLGNGTMSMMPGVFGGMPMNVPFGFPMNNVFQPNAQMMNNPMSLNPVQAAAAAAQGNATGRTVYIGNLSSDASVDELLNLVHFGPIESIRVLPERSCVFISFLDGATAASFHTDATMKKLSLHGQELKIGWGKPSPVPSQVMLSITQSNASRNVYLGGLDENMTEEMLRDDLSRFGLIDQVKIVRDKNIGFVHFLSIATASKVVSTLPTEPAWAGKRVNYGKDRCAYVPKSQAQQAPLTIPQTPMTPLGMGFNPFSPVTPNFGNTAAFDPSGNAAWAMAAMSGNQQMNRTVYLGNIHPDTTMEELCNAIRGGILQSVRYLADKHIAFVTFLEASAATTFNNLASMQGLMLNNRRLKVGWGKHPGPLAASVAMAVQSGATRNVYIGNIEDFDTFNVDKLKRDFGEYGETELVNFLKEKNCGFVNFTNISNAIKAIDGIKAKPEYTNLRIAHGKDRCANPPRVGGGPMGGANTFRKPMQNGNNMLQPTPMSAGHQIPSVGVAQDISVLPQQEGSLSPLA